MKPLLARRLSPQRILILGFAAAILGGAFLLWLPFSAAGRPIGLLDALFTSASAVCVTGLTVVDLGKDLSLAGQVISLFLFQAGGLGIITVSTVFFVMMGRGISFRGRQIVQSTFLNRPRADFLAIVRSILWFTLLFEGAGTILLWLRFSQEAPPAPALYLAVYHSVSAFNNCGFALFGDSLVRYQGDLLVNLTVMALVLAGGIGFIVLYEIWMKLLGRQRRLSLHARVVILTSAVLVLSGAALFYFFERGNTLLGQDPRVQVLVSFFQSISARTAGFQTVPVGLLTNQTLFLLILLMFVGASPGSAGGGVKTTSAALLVLLIWNRLRGGQEVNWSRRTIPRELVSRTVAILFASAFFISVGACLLLWFSVGGAPPAQSRHLFAEVLFESVSAFGTVGLSMGVTAQLNDLQKAAVILLMFAGRVGPLTLALSFFRAGAKRSLTYAEEGVMVG